MAEPTIPQQRRPLAGLLTTQFFGAFNDNAYKLLVALIAGDVATRGRNLGLQELETLRQDATTNAFVIFTLPLVLFSLPAAFLGDRYSKRTIIIAMKILELGIMAGATLSLYLAPDNIVPLLILLAGMGLQSALFSPAKFGILPQIVGADRLSKGNALLEMWSFLAIIGGYGVGGLLKKHAEGDVWIAGAVITAFSIIGFVASFGVPRVPRSATTGTSATVAKAWRAIFDDRRLTLTILGVSLFWSLASLMGQDVLVYAKQVLEVDDAKAGYTFAVFGIGVGAGSILSARLAGHTINPRLIPIGGLGMAIGILALGGLRPGYGMTLAMLLFCGVSAGLLIVPLHALTQWLSPDNCRGAVIAIHNVPVFGGVLLGSLACSWMAQAGLSSVGIILIAGGLNLVGALLAFWIWWAHARR